MNKILSYWILTIGLIIPAALLRAEEGGANPIKHPEIAYDQYKVKGDQKDIRDDHEKIRTTQHNEDYTKSEVALAKKKYERTLKSYGPNNDLTKEAKQRYEKAEKAYADAHREHAAAKKDLTRNRLELQDANHELSKNKAEEKAEIK